MPTWPATVVPQSWPIGVTQSTTNGLLRTSMDTGPVKLRKRYTANVTTYTLPAGKYIVTGAGRTLIETLYNSSLGGGVGSFTWDNPQGTLSSATETLTLRFVNPPTFTAIVSSADQDDQLFSVGLTFETVP